jgi:DNA-binding phage protein
MAKTVTSRYDVAEHLRTPEEMAAYLEACLEEADGDAAFVAKALGDIARAKGMTQVARANPSVPIFETGEGPRIVGPVGGQEDDST